VLQQLAQGAFRGRRLTGAQRRVRAAAALFECGWCVRALMLLSRAPAGFAPPRVFRVCGGEFTAGEAQPNTRLQ